VILDTDGNIFGGFTPVEWESRTRKPYGKADRSLKTFLFTLKNPHNFPARTFAFKAERNDDAVWSHSNSGPCFGVAWFGLGPGDIGVSDNCNANTNSSTFRFGCSYLNNTGLDGNTFFTGQLHFQVKEIEVFETNGLEAHIGTLTDRMDALQSAQPCPSIRVFETWTTDDDIL
jgi:hypothetical protein